MAEKETENKAIEESFNLAAAKHNEGDLEQAGNRNKTGFYRKL